MNIQNDIGWIKNLNELYSQKQDNSSAKLYSYLHTLEDEVTLDICQYSIVHIPDEFLAKFPKLQYLYLEGNELTELSDAFFPTLKQLKWLDVRNNRLTTVPTSIVDHCSLQVLLLEGNKIEKLPVEIGSLTSLRGIQLARNPIVYPPQTVINQGVQSTIEFLRKQWHQQQHPQHIQLISESHAQSKAVSPKPKPSLTKRPKAGACKSAVLLKVKSHESRCPRQVQSGLCAASLSKCISVRPISQHKQPVSVTTIGKGWIANDYSEEIFDPINFERKFHTHGNERKPLEPSTKIVKKFEEVQSKQLRDIWIEKIRQVLLTQEAILQRRKSAEALKQWQDETKTLQQTQTKKDSNVDISFPYDTDPEYLKMASRKDLEKDGGQRRRDSSLHYIRHEEPINSTILSIVAALQELQTSQSAASVSPRSEQRVLAQEIKKIKDIQRSLNALKLKNFGQLALHP